MNKIVKKVAQVWKNKKETQGKKKEERVKFILEVTKDWRVPGEQAFAFEKKNEAWMEWGKKNEKKKEDLIRWIIKVQKVLKDYILEGRQEQESEIKLRYVQEDDKGGMVFKLEMREGDVKKNIERDLKSINKEVQNWEITRKMGESGVEVQWNVSAIVGDLKLKNIEIEIPKKWKWNGLETQEGWRQALSGEMIKGLEKQRNREVAEDENVKNWVEKFRKLSAVVEKIRNATGDKKVELICKAIGTQGESWDLRCGEITLSQDEGAWSEGIEEALEDLRPWGWKSQEQLSKHGEKIASLSWGNEIRDEKDTSWIKVSLGDLKSQKELKSSTLKISNQTLDENPEETWIVMDRILRQTWRSQGGLTLTQKQEMQWREHREGMKKKQQELNNKKANKKELIHSMLSKRKHEQTLMDVREIKKDTENTKSLKKGKS